MSNGGKGIADIRRKYTIEFEYEHPILVKEQKEADGEKLKICYLDLWVPKYSIVIEYLGLNIDGYNKCKRAKLDTHHK